VTAFIADRGPQSIRVYTSDDRPRLAATMRRPDIGDDDQLLREHGWRRVGPWSRSDDMPEDHRVAVVVPA
jgi:hypothetical protein